MSNKTVRKYSVHTVNCAILDLYFENVILVLYRKLKRLVDLTLICDDEPKSNSEEPQTSCNKPKTTCNKPQTSCNDLRRFLSKSLNNEIHANRPDEDPQQ